KGGAGDPLGEVQKRRVGSHGQPAALRRHATHRFDTKARVAPMQQGRFSFREVIGAVWIPGLGSALGSVGFGAVTTFVALLFATHGWANGWLAYTAYAVAFILARIFFSNVADTFGGAKVALVFALVEAAGQALIWLAVSPEMA